MKYGFTWLIENYSTVCNNPFSVSHAFSLFANIHMATTKNTECFPLVGTNSQGVYMSPRLRRSMQHYFNAIVVPSITDGCPLMPFISVKIK